MTQLLILLLVLILIIAFKTIKIVNQAEVYVIERLGQFHKVAGAGLTIIIPFVDKVRAVVSLKKQIMDIKPQEVITLDNVSIAIDTVVFYQITDPIMAIYEIESLSLGIENLAVSAMRDVIGKMELDETFSSRDQINNKLRVVLDEATDPWGCKVEKVEIKEIRIPKDIQESMEKQMNAERTKRALLLQAEGERQSAITLAEGRKEAQILEAEAEKESQIRKATGQAEAIRRVADAEAQKIQLVYGAIRDASPDEKLVQIKALETLNEVAKGEANKIFIPFEATNSLASMGAFADVLKTDRPETRHKKHAREKVVPVAKEIIDSIDEVKK